LLLLRRTNPVCGQFLNHFVSPLTVLTGIIKDMKRIILVSLLFLLAACTAETAVEPVVESSATAVPPTAAVAEVAIEATAVATNPPAPTSEPAQAVPTQLPPTELPPTAVPEPVAAVEVVVEYGRTQEGAFYRGAANAPVTLIDFSDFL
jgi:hypothetical protein